jgi:plasmid stabilization system protein ParE
VSRKVRVTREAGLDILRLAEFLSERAPSVVPKARAAILSGITSLAANPSRGHASLSESLRELHVKFGRFGYVIQYRVDADAVVIARIFHGREKR